MFRVTSIDRRKTLVGVPPSRSECHERSNTTALEQAGRPIVFDSNWQDAVSKRLEPTTIRARLLVGFVLMALLSAIGISIGSVVVGYFNAQQDALNQLESVAARKQVEIKFWTDSLQNELAAALNEEYAFERASVVLDLAQENKYYDFYNQAMRNRLLRFVEQSRHLDELFLLDRRGRVLLSTDVTHEDQDYADQLFFQCGLAGPCAQIPVSILLQGRLSTIAAAPIINRDGKLIGVMAGRANTQTLQGILGERTSLGRTGKTYLVARNGDLLSEARLSATEVDRVRPQARLASSSPISAAIGNQVNGSGIYDDYAGTRVVGVYRWLPELGVALAIEQDLTETLDAIYVTLGVNVTIALIAVVLAISAALAITRSIANPLDNLVETATRIASGDLERVAKVERRDEVGLLAEAFNSMTAQLRDLIGSLEKRVTDRTRALQDANQVLERRAVQLETSAQVGRQVTSILDIDDLLTRVVDLIRDAFGYYQVLIYLADKETNDLVLRASSGPTNPQHQRLAIGKGSLNGEAVQNNQPLLVNNVAQDTRYLPDEQLPNTRSELVIPLRVADQVIGTLDVHSTQENAFNADDVLVIQSLSDQVAIAIENARLYERNRELAVLEERNRLARELHDSVTQLLYSQSLLTEGWRRLAHAGAPAHLEDYLNRVGEITQQALKEMRLLVHELRPPILERDGLLGALRQRLDAVENRAGVEARLIADDLVELPMPAQEGLYRIAQEALNNALKHAAATSVTVRIYSAQDQVVLQVTDNGKGFDPETAMQSGGMGLLNMRERAKQMGGCLDILSKPGEGATIRAALKPGGPEARQ